jgi:two-component system, chemotaxis family, protein-glutamate methylesterase/glutaminase
MSNRDIVAIGASAGGITAMQEVLGGLPADLAASLLVVLHISEHHPTEIEQVLSKAGRIPASIANDGEPMRQGHLYVAPPNRHLLVSGEGLRLGVGPRENGFRPSIDALFRSCVAEGMAGRTIGVVLSGFLDDGAAGLQVVQRHGGIAVVQDPRDAEHPDMPVNALRQVAADHVCSAENMGGLIARLASLPAGPSAPPSDEILLEVEIAGMAGADPVTLGPATNFVCPECNGVLSEIADGGTRRFRCHSGHAFSEQSLSYFMNEEVGRALAAALRALQERTMFFNRMADRAAESQNQALVKRYRGLAGDTSRHAKMIRDLMVQQVRGGTRVP